MLHIKKIEKDSRRVYALVYSAVKFCEQCRVTKIVIRPVSRHRKARWSPRAPPAGGGANERMYWHYILAEFKYDCRPPLDLPTSLGESTVNLTLSICQCFNCCLIVAWKVCIWSTQQHC